MCFFESLSFLFNESPQIKNKKQCQKATAQKADQVFLPVLENAAKAQKLRSTLGVFERSKFFFNLPGSLMESIEAVRHWIFFSEISLPFI